MPPGDGPMGPGRAGDARFQHDRLEAGRRAPRGRSGRSGRSATPCTPCSARTPSAGLRVRSALAEADALTRALGRPDREQVVTRRDSVATTLQALELTNGAVPGDGCSSRAARSWLARPEAKSPDRLIDASIAPGIGRAPTDAERAVGPRLVGSPADEEGSRICSGS